MTIGLSLVMLGCQPTPSDPAQDSTFASEPTVPKLLGPWAPCETEAGLGQFTAECATANLPLDYADPGGSAFEAMVKRLPAPAPETGQVWVLHGGPGGSAVDDIFSLSLQIQTERPDLGVYAIDHRGIGGTLRMTCEDQEHLASEGGTSISDAEWPSCIDTLLADMGNELPHLTTSNSARDVGTLISHLAQPDQQVFVYGASYGTYLAQRYLHLFPDQPTGVVIEGIAPPTPGFIGYDANMNAVAQELMDVCAADSTCRDHFQGNPWQIATDVVASFDDGHCLALSADSDAMRYLLGAMLFFDGIRDLVPAAVHRMQRCNAEDQSVLLHLWERLIGIGGVSPSPGNTGLGNSQALFFHVALSEMWWEPGQQPGLNTQQAAWRELTMATGLETWLAGRAETWPTYPPDAYDDALPTFDGPMLMLQGGLDAATTASKAELAADHFDGADQTWALFPTAPHNVMYQQTFGGSYCARDIYLAFLDEPTEPLDLSCIDDVMPPNFDGDPQYADWYLGTTDAWGD